MSCVVLVQRGDDGSAHWTFGEHRRALHAETPKKKTETL